MHSDTRQWINFYELKRTTEDELQLKLTKTMQEKYE